MLTGRVPKDTADVIRVTVDFVVEGWLDAGEVISSVSVPTVIVEQLQVIYAGQVATNPIPPPVDTTPLVVVSSSIVDSGQQVQLMLGVGTPGLTYRVEFVATGSVSGRQKTIDILVIVRQPV